MRHFFKIIHLLLYSSNHVVINNNFCSPPYITLSKCVVLFMQVLCMFRLMYIRNRFSHCCHLLRWFRKYQYLANHARRMYVTPVRYCSGFVRDKRYCVDIVPYQVERFQRRRQLSHDADLVHLRNEE